MSESISKPIYRPKKISLQDIRDGCIRLHGSDGTETEICVAQEELRAGIDFIRKYERSVTCFGSHILGPETPAYQQAERLAGRIVRELNYAVASGGGPGIMEAVNKGAFEAGGQSLGLTIQIAGEEPSPYVTDSIDFHFFFNRKTILAYEAEVYLFFPGSYGTFDELFTTITLIATNKIPPAPLVLVGVEFWSPLVAFIQKTVSEGVTPENYVSLLTLTDDEDQILEIIKGAPLRREQSLYISNELQD